MANEDRKRWQGRINAQGARQVHPVDEDNRPHPQVGAALSAFGRPARRPPRGRNAPPGAPDPRESLTKSRDNGRSGIQWDPQPAVVHRGPHHTQMTAVPPGWEEHPAGSYWSSSQGRYVHPGDAAWSAAELEAETGQRWEPVLPPGAYYVPELGGYLEPGDPRWSLAAYREAVGDPEATAPGYELGAPAGAPMGPRLPVEVRAYAPGQMPPPQAGAKVLYDGPPAGAPVQWSRDFTFDERGGAHVDAGVARHPSADPSVPGAAEYLERLYGADAHEAVKYYLERGTWPDPAFASSQGRAVAGVRRHADPVASSKRPPGDPPGDGTLPPRPTRRAGFPTAAAAPPLPAGFARQVAELVAEHPAVVMVQRQITHLYTEVSNLGRALERQGNIASPLGPLDPLPRLDPSKLSVVANDDGEGDGVPPEPTVLPPIPEAGFEGDFVPPPSPPDAAE